MIRLGCGEFEQLEFNGMRKSIYATESLLLNRINRLKNKHTVYLKGIKNVMLGEKNGSQEEI